LRVFVKHDNEEGTTMRHDWDATLAGFGLGAALMYFLDPDRGRRRRAVAKDKLVHSTKVSVDALGTTGRDLANRAAGASARIRNAFQSAPADDSILADRVRATLGRHVSHPRAIDVTVADGQVTLSGPVLEQESRTLLPAIERMPGVHEVVNALEEHEHADDAPLLQGGRTPARPRPDVFQRRWTPTTRLMIGGAGAALAGYGGVRRDKPGALLAATGFGLIASAATNMEAKRLTGVGARRRAVDLEKTITIDAPVEDVFNFWTSYENFPRFMSRVLDVRPSARQGESHWRVAGPAGAPIEFDAEESTRVPNRAFGWRTVEGALVGHAGLVRFEAADDDHTRLNVRMSYNPPGGWLGHGIARAFGVDPRSSLDADLLRMKTLLEAGRTPEDAAAPVH
jgi:uncharacterized membrane protein